MSLNATPNSSRVHIGFFGRANVGKSSLVNALLNQGVSIVSDTKGTTTDPVQKAMELLPIGPVLIIDTPGLDDEGELGSLRVQASYRVLETCDMAVLVVDGPHLQLEDKACLERIQEKKIPYVIAYNKCDTYTEDVDVSESSVVVSATQKENIETLRARIAQAYQGNEKERAIVSDLLQPQSLVVLVVPIDKAAPKGRLILPIQQTIRDLLDAGMFVMTCRDAELEALLQALPKQPDLVITDSQVFGFVNQVLPKEVPLTSFSILMARYKGLLQSALQAIEALDHIKDGDRILISEGCSHRRQCGDIGTQKIPHWIENYTKKKVEFVYSSGKEFPDDLRSFAFVVHCGGCMLHDREMRLRLSKAQSQGVGMTNYGVLIAAIHGILSRSIEPLNK